jgi:uncharacterized protein with von Willebrand factor type A (vWA) domain
MDARLVEFAGLLRANGVRVGPAEVIDAAASAALVGVADRAAFRAALRATLVKRSRDVPVFDGLFEIYFSGIGRLLEGVETGILRALREEGLLEADELEMIARTLDRLAAESTPLGRAALTGDRAALARLLRGAALGLDLSFLGGPAAAAFHGRRLLAAAGGAGLHEDARKVERALREAGLDPSRLEIVARKLGEALRAVEDAARRYAELEQAARTQRPRQEGLLPRAPAALSREEILRTEAAVRRLAERLKARLVRRDRARRRGALSVRRTLRLNLGLGGFPARLLFRRRRPERPDLVVLCDVSESVRHVTRLMLLFLYTLQTLFHRVRTFVFVSDLAEVTGALRAERDPARAADLATAAKAVSLAANSSYGRALATFHARHLGLVTRRTTVLVLGDGRNNFNPPNAWALDEIRRRARRLLWICPEPRWSWGTGDSEMPLYASRCDRVATVATLDELEQVADALVPRGTR